MEQAQGDGSLTGFKGVHNAIVDAITATDLDIRKELYSNILVTGGNTNSERFTHKLNNLLGEIANQNAKVKIL